MRQPATPGGPFTPFDAEDTEQSIGARFDQIARRFASHAAVVTENSRWTYSELAERASVVAARLMEGPAAVTVTLLFDHGPWMIAAILGALKAGIAYVPVDPALPFERQATILRDAQCRVILTDAENRTRARELAGEGIAVVEVETLSLEADCPSLPEVDPDRMAYLLYTSASTGTPKAVMQSHRNVLRHIRAYTNALAILCV
jgi:non-ribosomal peptide synthetase component F